MKRITTAAVAASLVAVVLLAACSHSGAGHSSASGSGPAGGAAVDGAAPPGTASEAGAAPAALPAGPAKDPAAAALLTPVALIRTADLNVEIASGHSVAAQADRAEQIAVDARGQVYADARSAGTRPTATLTLKVPAASLARVLAQLSALGKEMSRHTSTQDVTTQVADVTSRVESARASIDRLRILFARAAKVGDVIALESELAQREADLESLQAQQRALAAQTAMATVTLGLRAAAAVARTHHATRGFLGGLHRGWRTFASAAGGLATATGAAVPFLVLALLLAAVAVLVRRRARTGAPPPVIPPADPA